MRFATLALFLLATCSLPGVSLRADDPTPGRLFFLDLRGGRVISAAPDGSDVKVLGSGRSGIPDGIAVDTERGHIYWTIMGKAAVDDGLIERSDLDGGRLTTIVPAGGTFTPKQLKLDPVHRKLYWSDREGMRVMRATMAAIQPHLPVLLDAKRGDMGPTAEAYARAKELCPGERIEHISGVGTPEAITTRLLDLISPALR